MTHFELKFTGSSEVIAVFEFDIGSYAGEASDDRMKTLFDLKSEKYYGSQIDIVLRIEHLDQLPEFLQENVYGHVEPVYADQVGAHMSNQNTDTEIERKPPSA